MYNRRSNSTDSLSLCCDDTCRSALWEHKKKQSPPCNIFCACECVCVRMCVQVWVYRWHILMLWRLPKSCSMPSIWSQVSSHAALEGARGSTAWGKNIPLILPLISHSAGLVVPSGFWFRSCSIRVPPLLFESTCRQVTKCTQTVCSSGTKMCLWYTRCKPMSVNRLSCAPLSLLCCRMDFFCLFSIHKCPHNLPLLVWFCLSHSSTVCASVGSVHKFWEFTLTPNASYF